ncbi:MAG: GNAT family N-acetyltransferase [Microlunatus sp.]
MATVHTLCWQETYRGLVDDHILDSPTAAARREQMWMDILSEEADGSTAVAVAEADGIIIGIACAGKPRDDDATWPIELFVLYLRAGYHGSGAGRALLDAVVGDEQASLWVADPNPRAQAFYRKAGFVPDGMTKDEGIPEIRMVRG